MTRVVQFPRTAEQSPLSLAGAMAERWAAILDPLEQDLAVARAFIRRQMTDIATLIAERDHAVEVCNQAIRRNNATFRELQRLKARLIAWERKP